jgi:hypothetical protein
MLLVIANAPKDPLAQTQGAQLAGLPPADFSRRLAGTMPRVLLAAAPADQIGSLVDGFESLGFAAFSCAGLTSATPPAGTAFTCATPRPSP